MGKLILTRKPGESVKIGDSLVLTIREVHPKKVYIQPNDGTPLCFRLDEHFDCLLGSADYVCRVTIAAISGRQVRLHFEADNSIKIVRTELL